MSSEAIDDALDFLYAKKVKKNKNKIQLRKRHNQLLKDIDRICKKHSVSNPGAFLTEVMVGVDPRSEGSTLFDVVAEIVDRGIDELPTYDEWFEIVDMILTDDRYKKEGIALETSIRAAENLSRFMYPKLKEVNVDVEGDMNHNVKLVPLSKKEIKKFKKYFEENY